MLKIGFVVYPQCMPAGLFAGLDFLAAANAVADKKIFEAKIVGLSRGSVACAHGQKVTPEIAVHEFDFDALVVPGFWGYSAEEVQRVATSNRDLQDYLNRISKKKTLISYCTGVVFHAQTKRLEKKGATASWWMAQDLMRGFPSVRWHVNKIWAGDELDLTAAGANGFYPLLSQLVLKMAGKKVLAEVQKYLMTPTQFNINDPFYELEILSSKERVLKIRKFVERTAGRDINLSLVATHLGVSTKTLARKLQEDVKWTPAMFFRLIKLRQAGSLLASTEDSVKEICDHLGFDDEAHFRKSFKQHVGFTPAEYKRRFARQ